MYNRSDPRVRRTLNQLSQNIESANESAQINLFTFTQTYIKPCFAGVSSCFGSCGASAAACVPCFPTSREQARNRRHHYLQGRARTRTRGRAEASFDFYDDWDDEDDEAGSLLGWGNEEASRLLSSPIDGGGGGGYGATTTTNQGLPQNVIMGFGGAARRDNGGGAGGRGRGHRQSDIKSDPTLIPTTSYFGFFNRWFGGKGVRYKPSVAGLQEHPGGTSAINPGMHDEDPSILNETASGRRDGHRNRRFTSGSQNTTESYSSRGDLFPSDDEDDAVALDDEFAMVLERRTTGSGTNDGASGKYSDRDVTKNTASSTRTASAEPKSLKRSQPPVDSEPTSPSVKMAKGDNWKEPQDNEFDKGIDTLLSNRMCGFSN